MPDDVIENPVTGERFHFLSESDATRLSIETTMRPLGFAPFMHVHHSQQERFVVIKGRTTFRVAGKEFDAFAGDEVVVPAGTPHVLFNPTDDEVRVLTEFTPPLRSEEMFRTFCRLAQTKRFTRRGFPWNPFIAAMFAREFRDEARVSDFRFRALELLAPIGAAMGRAFGLKI